METERSRKPALRKSGWIGRYQEPVNLFRSSVSIDCTNEAFVPHRAALLEIERQSMLDSECLGLLLYGRHGTGKSTLLRNLSSIVPPSIVHSYLSMQDPQCFSSFRKFVEHTAMAIHGVVKFDDEPSAEDLDDLFAVLCAANAELIAVGQLLFLSVDEYEMIDRKVDVFSENLLATVRESIQANRHITWIFAGSHKFDELGNLPWGSYLESVRTVEIGFFTEQETRLLLTEPLHHSKRWQKGDLTRPCIDPSFWGEDGIERIHVEAGGWPCLVQLIAETTIDLIGDEKANQVEERLFERALAKAIVRGHSVFHDLLRGESMLPGEWEYLEAFGKHETQAPPTDEDVARSLRRRQLVVEDAGVWRLRVPLMRRWLRERG